MPLPDESSQASVQSLKALFEGSCSSPDKQQQQDPLPSPIHINSSPRPFGRVRSSFIAVDKGRAALNFFERSPSPVFRTVSMPVSTEQENAAAAVAADGPERLFAEVYGTTVEKVTELAVEQTAKVSDEADVKASMIVEETLQKMTEPSKAQSDEAPAKFADQAGEKVKEMAVEPLMAQADNTPGGSSDDSSKTPLMTIAKIPQKGKIPSSKTTKAAALVPAQNTMTSVSPRAPRKKQVDTQSLPPMRSTRSQSSMRSASPLDLIRPPSASIGRAFGRSGRPAESLAHGSPPPRTASLMATSKEMARATTPLQ